jgi:hypothetical protein
MNNVRRVLIMTPAQSYTPEYVASLCQTFKFGYENNINVDIHTAAGSHVGQLREIMVEQIRISRLAYDKMLWIDSDIQWTVEDFAKIISSPHPITVGSYHVSSDGKLSSTKQFGSNTTETCALAINPISNSPSFFLLEELDSLPEYVGIYTSGFGFVCISRGVFGEMEVPYFSNKEVHNPSTGEKTFETSEDASWFIRAHEAGFKPMLDTTIRLGHVKTVVWK